MEKQRTSVALGFFDGVHLGHRRVIEKAVALAQGNLIPAVFTFTMDGSAPAKKQGVGEITTLEQKIRILKGMGIQQIYAPDFSDFHNMSGEAFVYQILKEKDECRGSLLWPGFPLWKKGRPATRWPYIGFVRPLGCPAWFWKK